MRKLFLMIMSVSALAVVFGGVAYAWTTTATSPAFTTNGGALNVAITGAVYNGNEMYPTDTWTPVVYGFVLNNTSADPGVPVIVTGGSVTGDGNYQACISNSKVDVIGVGPIAAGGNQGGEWQASLAMPTNALQSCMGLALGYSVTINVATP